MPLPIGFLELVDKFSKEINVELHIKSKCGVSPLITQPNAINPSYFFKFFDIKTGISKVPGALIITMFFFFSH